MDYTELISKLSGQELRDIAVKREIQCAYLDNGADLDGNTGVLLKTILPKLINEDNIRNAISKFNSTDLLKLKTLLNAGSCTAKESEPFHRFAFFATDENGTIYFPDALKTVLEELDVNSELVDERELISGHLAYAIYITVANGILMKKTRCLHDMTPGKRMVEYVSEKLNRTISRKAFSLLYDFMMASGTLLPGNGEERIMLPEKLPSRDFFYTNLFKYMAANLPDGLFSELMAAGKTTGKCAVMEKSRFALDNTRWELLQLCDFIKAIGPERFVFTDISIQFMDSRKVTFSAAEREDFFVLPGFRILAEQNISDEVLNTLARVTLLESFDQVFHFVFNSCSLIQTRKQNLGEKDLVSFIEEHSAQCPPDLKLMIRDTFERFGEVKILSGFPILICQTNNLKERIAALDEISRYIFYEEDRLIALHGAKKPRELKRLLVEKGLIPELDISKDFIPLHRADMDEVTAFLRKLAAATAEEDNSDHPKLMALFDKLQVSPEAGSNPNAPELHQPIKKTHSLTIEKKGTIPLEDRMEILQLAIARHYRVKVLYKQKGSNEMEERIIAPKFFDGDFLVAFCESRNADRRFNLYRLELAGIIVEG
ncbi:MAG: hypothetical protein DRJ08_03070 [Acidobacteria bacterium]|nr:MAG: hypothetical protein DRJ14_03145 [Acidobacteriota bacterium]RLE23107.1 MAG: hypothetical protein DRJ08_03070 [Acidobacteriota bacterium]